MKRIYNKDRVIMIIRQQFPDFTVNQITDAGAGNDCEAFLVNGETIFKFPKHRGASENLSKEMSILMEIHNKLPIATPKVVFQGCPSESFPMYFIGCSKIEGEILTRELLKSLSPDIQEQVAFDLAHFLKHLHSITLNTPSRNFITDIRGKYLEDYEKILKVIKHELREDQKQRVDEFYQSVLKDTDYFRYTPCLLHNDLSSDHIFYDRSQNRICGIIDFGDAGISDPDYDFLGLMEDEEEYGREFGLKVLKYYQHRNIDLVLKKFHLKEKYWSFEKILYGMEYGLDEWCREGMDEIKRI